MSTLRIIQLGKGFGDVAALDGVSLDVAAGEFLVVCGPSGSGKSTLLRLLAGLEAASSGEIRFGEGRFDVLPPERREVALIAQNPALLPQLTVAENLGIGLRLRKVPSSEAKQRISEAAERLGLVSLLERRPAQLSGGEQQRVALGRVLVSRPRLLLLDEPLSQLDPELRRGLRREIHRLQRELKVPAIHVTHDQDEAMELSDRLAVMRGGRLEQCGTPAELHRSPATPFVAEFMATAGINRFRGRIQADAQGRWFEAEGLRWAMPQSLPPDDLGGTRWLYLRPEAIRVLPPASSDTGVMVRPGLLDGLAMDGTVTRVARLGWEQRIELSVDGRTLLVRTTETWPLEAGMTVRWTVNWSEALWFSDGRD